MLRIRAFYACNEPETGLRFVEGHRQVLESIGVKVTSGGAEWVNKSNVIVLVVENTETNAIVGGARLHIATETDELPMETAISKVDNKVHDFVKIYRDNGVAEVCGLWNSNEIAGLGIGSNTLVRACIALSEQAGLDSLVALVAKHTYRRATHKGFEVVTTLGDEGKFNYPKLDLIATAILLKDPLELSSAKDAERELISEMRNRVNFVNIEKWPKGEYQMEYNLNLEVLQEVN